MTPTPVLPSLPEHELWPLIRAFVAASVDCDRSNGAVSQQYHRLAESNLRDAIESLSRAPASSPLGRDADWALAMAGALGTDSGFSVPIVPSVEAFRMLFDAVRSRAPAEPADRWYVGSMNDGCFIINKPPRPSHDYPVHDAEVKCITGFPSNCAATFKVAQAICDAHNAGPAPAEVVRELTEALRALVDRDFTFFCGEMLGATRKITRDEVLAARAAIKLGESHEG